MLGDEKWKLWANYTARLGCVDCLKSIENF